MTVDIFSEISIRGFRRLNRVDLQLRPLNVVIGANGSGKTSLLEVFSLLSASAGGALAKTINEMGGLKANLANLQPSNDAIGAAFSLKRQSESHADYHYQLQLEVGGIGYNIISESLHHNQPPDPPFYHFTSDFGNVLYYEPVVQKKLIPPTWGVDDSETILSQFPKFYSTAEGFRKHLASSTHYHTLDVGSRAVIRLPQTLRTASLPGANGEDLVSCLYSIRESEPDRFEVIEDTLRAAFPSFERLGFPPVAAGTLAMTWKERTSPNPFYMHQLSEGMLRFLWLVTLLHSPGLPAVTMIDEPEVSLHPELLSLLADLFREASTRTQLIIATHADRLVRFLRPDEVIATTIEDNGSTSFHWGDSCELNDWLADYSLDQLWQMGRLGGRA